MSFTCYSCFARHALMHTANLTAEDLVARDAALTDRREEAVRVIVEAGHERDWAEKRVDELLRLEIEIPSYRHVGEHEAWPNDQVWLPGVGISVGPCEDCRQTRPCVNM